MMDRHRYAAVWQRVGDKLIDTLGMMAAVVALLWVATQVLNRADRSVVLGVVALGVAMALELATDLWGIRTLVKQTMQDTAADHDPRVGTADRAEGPDEVWGHRMALDPLHGSARRRVWSTLARLSVHSFAASPSHDGGRP
jgi:hypothetical protein